MVHPGYAGKTPPPGHMLQIFVHRDWVNDAAYPSAPYGIYLRAEGTICNYADKTPVSGQARVFMHPDIFAAGHAKHPDDLSAKSHVFHYCATPELCSSDPAAGELTRGALRDELQLLLGELIGDVQALKRTRAAIEGHAFVPGGQQQHQRAGAPSFGASSSSSSSGATAAEQRATMLAARLAKFGGASKCAGKSSGESKGASATVDLTGGAGAGAGAGHNAGPPKAESDQIAAAIAASLKGAGGGGRGGGAGMSEADQIAAAIAASLNN